MRRFLHHSISRITSRTAVQTQQLRSDARLALAGWNDRMRLQSESSRHGTRWGRGSVLMLPASGVVALLATQLASGAMAASFNVANAPLEAHIDTIDGTGIAAVISSVNAKNADGSTTPIGTLRAVIGKGKLKGVCIIAKQTVMSHTYSVVIKAAQTGEGVGQNITLDASQAQGFNVNLKNVNVGRSADEVGLNGQRLGGEPGGLGIDGPDATVHLERLVGTAYSAELLGAIQASDFTASVKPGEVTAC